SRRRHTSSKRDWSSDVCSSDLSRNMQLALRRLRKFTREGREDEFDLDGTISSTAKNAGLLDIRMRPEEENRIKVLIFFDIGGSMDPYIALSEELFSAARSEFKHMEYYYFQDRKSTRLNSSHVSISYAVFCLKKK